jgi:hypothetical protein
MPFSIRVAANWNQTAEPGAIAILFPLKSSLPPLQRGGGCSDPLKQKFSRPGQSSAGSFLRSVGQSLARRAIRRAHRADATCAPGQAGR